MGSGAVGSTDAGGNGEGDGGQQAKRVSMDGANKITTGRRDEQRQPEHGDGGTQLHRASTTELTRSPLADATSGDGLVKDDHQGTWQGVIAQMGKPPPIDATRGDGSGSSDRWEGCRRAAG
jgi:hypothetical protein